MKTKTLAYALYTLTLLYTFNLYAATKCTDFNYYAPTNHNVYNPIGREEHSWGGTHQELTNEWFSCLYTGPYKYQGQLVCVPTATSYANVNLVEYQKELEVNRPDTQPGVHYLVQDRITQSNTGQLNGGDEPGASTCIALFGTSCQVGDPNCGPAILTTQWLGGNSCGYNVYQFNGYSGYYLPSMYHAWVWGPDTCSFYALGTYTPIVLDYSGKDNFQNNFTDADGGIYWNWYGNKRPNAQGMVHLAWSKAESDVMFLWLDRQAMNGFTACFMALDMKGCNNKLDSAIELFSDIAPQQAQPGTTSGAHPAKPSGWGALTMFDRKKFGGNEDGRIDKNDKVWKYLRAHKGKPDSGIDYTMEELGIVSIGLDYKENGEKDRYGNTRWLEGSVVTNNSKTVAIYDVLFVGHE